MFNYAGLNYTPKVAICWYNISTSGNVLLSTSTSLSSSLINLNDQIFFTAFPSVINFDGSIGIGITVNSDIYAVAP